jgi:hypothetical protein
LVDGDDGVARLLRAVTLPPPTLVPMPVLLLVAVFVDGELLLPRDRGRLVATLLPAAGSSATTKQNRME